MGDEESTQQVVTSSQTYEALDTTMKWLESQDDTDPTHLLLVQKWRDKAAVKRTEALKQKKLHLILKQLNIHNSMLLEIMIL